MDAPRIAIDIPFTNTYGRQVLRGIAFFAHTRTPWRFLGNPVYTERRRPEINAESCDGAIVYATTAEAEVELAARGVPVVNVSGRAEPRRLPRRRVDNAAIGRMGCEHLLSLGARDLAFIEPTQEPTYPDRREAFLARAAEAGHRPHLFQTPGHWHDGSWLDADKEGLLEAFLRDLPKPVAIMAPADSLAARILAVCQRLEIAVPESVAVLGVGDDEFVCDFAYPSLSSIDVDARRLGYEAALLLHRLLSGGREVDLDEAITPSGVVRRESTEAVLAVDPVARAALRWIREHACEGVDVPQVAEAVGVGRRALERHFERALGCSPHQAIRRVQMETAAWLLEKTDQPVAIVAEHAGFRDPRYFAKVFRAAYDTTPAAYRRSQTQATSRGKHSAPVFGPDGD